MRPSRSLPFDVCLSSSFAFINRGPASPRWRWASLQGFKQHPLIFVRVHAARTCTLLSSLPWLFLLSSLRKIGTASRRTWFISNRRTVEEIFKDYSARRTALVCALTYDVDEFYSLYDPGEARCTLGFLFIVVFPSN
ncbi:hypothetical protein NL676_015140 [Syzygium grande]|nr:hypothetical protein NL676_015140 [Syzygium grande]